MKMKVYILCSFIIVLINCSTTKSAGNNLNSRVQESNNPNPMVKKDSIITDTLHYVQAEFIDKKQKYINKPLDSILNDLKIDIISFKWGSAANNRYIVPSISLSFCSKNETVYRSLVSSAIKPVIVWVAWQNPLSADSVHQLLVKSANPGDWGIAERKYFGKQIVKDFGVVNFNR
jgi:hypothetical protein